MINPNPEVLEVKVTRIQLHKVFMTPGYAWKWLYETTIPEIRLTAGNGLASNDDRNLPYKMSGTLDEVKRAVKLLAPRAKIVETWK